MSSTWQDPSYKLPRFPRPLARAGNPTIHRTPKSQIWTVKYRINNNNSLHWNSIMHLNSFFMLIYYNHINNVIKIVVVVVVVVEVVVEEEVVMII